MFITSIALAGATLAALNADQAPKVKKRAARSLRAADARYQKFFKRNIDTLMTSSTRLAQEEEFDQGASEKEATVNRRLGLSLATTGAAGVGVLGVPILSPVLMAASGGVVAFLCFEIAAKYARVSWREKRLKYYFVCSTITGTAMASGLYVLPAAIASVIYYCTFKASARSEAAVHDSMRRAFGLQPPQMVWRVVDGVEVEIPFEELQIGDTVAVSAGQTIPIDGVVVDGEGAVDQHALTGESVPVEKGVDDEALANTVLIRGRLHVRVEKAGDETAAAQIGAILVSASGGQLASSSETEEFVDGVVTPALIVVGGVSFLTLGPAGPLAVFNSGFSTPLMSGPLNMLTYLNIASEQGVLIKDGRSLERLNKVDAVVFDKTGTLTIEQPKVAKTHAADGADPLEVLRLAAIAEHRQSHPIAKAILAEAEAKNIALTVPDEAAYAVGMGVAVSIDGQTVRIGSARFLRGAGVRVPSEAEEWREAADAVGGSLVFVARDDACVGAVRLEAQLRPDTEELIQKLQARGVKTYILSGDAQRPTQHMGDILGVDGVFAEVMPEEKAAVIQQLQEQGRTVCFVGDGLNDALALRQADVSVSMRGATTLATDNAQVVLMSPALSPIYDLFEIGDSFDRNLKRTLACAYAPAGVVIGGVLVFSLSVPMAFTLFSAGIIGSVSTALAPMRRIKRIESAPQIIEGRKAS